MINYLTNEVVCWMTVKKAENGRLYVQIYKREGVQRFHLESDVLASSWKNTSESQGFIFWMTGDKDLLLEEF